VWDAEAKRRPAARVRRPPGEVTKLLRQAGFSRDSAPFVKSRKAPPVPDGAAYLTRTFTCEAGSRDYTVYVPSHTDRRKRPLIIMLHRRLRKQSMRANRSACWNWFRQDAQGVFELFKKRYPEADVFIVGQAQRNGGSLKPRRLMMFSPKSGRASRPGARLHAHDTR
jgi:hypothetical protein